MFSVWVHFATNLICSHVTDLIMLLTLMFKINVKLPDFSSRLLVSLTSKVVFFQILQAHFCISISTVVIAVSVMICAGLKK